ncbi:MAG: PhnD/SsuA/transferrin family substrate-binding protein [Rhodocyclaceae bacterium]
MQLTISPDVNLKYLPGWFTFNVWLQKRLERPSRFRVFDDFEACRQALRQDEIDLIYANPYDAALLLREKGFLPVAKPLHQPDEAVIAVREEAPWSKIEDLEAGGRFARAGDPEVDMICKIMLEPADLTVEPTQLKHCDNYVVVAKEVLNGSVDVGFFSARAYDDLSSAVRKRLRVLLRSQIFVLHHLLLLSPRAADLHDRLQQILAGQNGEPAGQRLLADMGLSGWQPLEREEAEFMIDMMDTLT